MIEIHIKSTLDNSLQPSLFYKAQGENRPLIVGLHTWSYDRFNQQDIMGPYAQKLDWNLLLPEFRGSNTESNPHPTQACGSDLAKQDIIDAVDYICDNYSVDKERIFLLGCSGGGHMALLMSAYAPDLWRAVDAWVPITSLADWHSESQTRNIKYAINMEACCGGKPDASTIREYAHRSPISYGHQLAKANIRINHGKYDPIVPFTHSVNMYNEILRINRDARVYLNIFDGGHERNMEESINWLISQTTDTKAEEVTG